MISVLPKRKEMTIYNLDGWLYQINRCHNYIELKVFDLIVVSEGLMRADAYLHRGRLGG